MPNQHLSPTTKTSNPYVFFKEVVALSTMKRLTLDRYIRKAEDLGLVKKQVTGNVIYITDKGSDYLVEKKIIDE